MTANKLYLLIIATCLLYTIQARAEVLTVGSAAIYPGETINVPITVDVPDNIAGAAFTVTYNSQYFTLTDIASNFFDTFVNQWIALDPQPNPLPPVQVSIDGADYTLPLLHNDINGGTMIAAVRIKKSAEQNRLFTLQFTADVTVPLGNYPLIITASSITNTAGGYSTEGEDVSILVGALENENNPNFAYPPLQTSIVNGMLVVAADSDIDNDGLPDDFEVVLGTDPANADTDNDGLQDGTECGYTVHDIGFDTDTNVFLPDLDPSTQTDPLLADTDSDGKLDGEEDFNANGRVDTGERDPLDQNDPCSYLDYLVVNPMFSTYTSSDTDRVVFFNSSQSSCYEMVNCIKKDRACTDEWDFGGLGGIVGGNGDDIVVYQYDDAGDYTASLTMTEPDSGITATDDLTVTAEIVQTPLPDIDFSSELSSANVSITITELDPSNTAIESVIVYWGDRYRDEYSLPATINHSYTRTGADYHIRVKAININDEEFNYTFTYDEDLMVSIP